MKAAKPIFLAFSLFAFATAFAAGGSDQGSGSASAQGGSSQGSSYQPKKTFSQLDRDNDGNIGMMEAAADPDAKMNFKKMDKNNDLHVSQQEWQAYHKGSAAGASSEPGTSSKK